MAGRIFTTLLTPWFSEAEQGRIDSTYSGDWHAVEMHKRNGDGSYVTIGQHHQSQMSNRRIRRRLPVGLNVDDPERFICHLNGRTGELFALQPPSLVALKCAEITFGAPLFAVIKTILELGCYFYRVSVEAYHFLSVEQLTPASFGRFGKEQLVELGQMLGQIGTIFFVSVGMVIAAVEGLLFDPFKGQTQIAILDQKWNGFSSRQLDVRRIGMGVIGGRPIVYIASCFQSKGRLTDRVNEGSDQAFEILNQTDDTEEIYRQLAFSQQVLNTARERDQFFSVLGQSRHSQINVMNICPCFPAYA
ncbi:MAG: hypothetical protein S4CHLAM102_03520 [Chlamydiia bacterium]|nr:hypothetical protein [Chlamydiia bacterium]